MYEFAYCQNEPHIIGNLFTKQCEVAKKLETNCARCPYNQTLFENQLPEKYRNKMKYMMKFALPKWLSRYKRSQTWGEKKQDSGKE
jgi:hypothetical protein